MKPDFVEILRTHGHRATQGRIDILKVLYKAKKPLSVADISATLPQVLDIATLYRALSALAHEGVILRGTSSGPMRAALFSYPKGAHHHHMICTDCGFIKSCNTC